LKNYSSIIAFLGILILIIIPIYEVNNTSQDYLDIVTKSFQVTKGEFSELNIEAWAQINKKGLLADELHSIFQDIAETLSISPEPAYVENYNGFIRFYQEQLLENSVYLQISLQSIQSEGLESGTFLGMQINCNDLEKSRKYYSLINQIFSSNNAQNEIGVTIVGTFPGQLSQEEFYKKSALAFASVNGQIIEGIDTEELISYSGYTPDCNSYLDVAGQKINLNAALRYHTIDDKTYIHIGAPLIFQEY